MFRRKNKINPALLEKNFNGEIVEFIRFSEKVSFTFANWPFQNADLSMADVQRKIPGSGMPATMAYTGRD